MLAWSRGKEKERRARNTGMRARRLGLWRLCARWDQDLLRRRDKSNESRNGMSTLEAKTKKSGGGAKETEAEVPE